MSLPITPWLITPNPRPQANWRLFCFPYAGGAARIYQPWATALPSNVEVCAVELPGHGRRLTKPPITQLATLIQHLEIAIQPWLDKPFVFFGHSLGALVAFELARSLRQHQCPIPALLWVSAARAPHLISPNPPIYQLPQADFIAELRRYSGTPDEVLANAELMELLLPMLRADFALLETYRYHDQAPLTFPITAFGGEADAIVSLEDIRPWQIHTDAAFTLERVAGDHFFVHNPQTVSLLIQEIARLSHSYDQVI